MWPESPARLAPDLAVATVDGNRHRFKSDLDYRLVRLIASYYPWPFMSLAPWPGAGRLRATAAAATGLPAAPRPAELLLLPAEQDRGEGRPYAAPDKPPRLHEEMVLCRLCEGCGKPLEPGADRRKRVHDDRCRKRRDRAAQSPRSTLGPNLRVSGKTRHHVRENTDGKK